MCQKETCSRWNPWEVLVSQSNVGKYAVVILNTPINPEFKAKFIIELWQKGI